jgi:hypothetical protein
MLRRCLLLSCLVMTGGASSVVAAQTMQLQPGYPEGYQGYAQQAQPAFPQQAQPDYQQQPVQQPPVAPGYYPPQGGDQAQAYGYPQQQGYPQGYVAPGLPMITSVKGQIQVGAGIALFGYSSLSLSPSSSNPTAPSSEDPTAAPVPMVGTTCCGSPNPFLVEAGYGLSDQMILGAQLQLGGHSESLGTMAPPAKEFMFSIGPKFDYQLAPTSRWNPFVGGVVNLTLASKSYYGVKQSNTLFGILARTGMRYFVIDGLSIDPTIAIGARFGSGSQNTDPTASNELSYSLSGFQFALSVGLSLWIK